MPKIEDSRENLRIPVSTEERMVLDRVITRFGLTKNNYVITCLRHVDGPLNSIPETGVRAASAPYFAQVPGDVAKRARAKAAALGMPYRTWARQRILGGPSHRPPNVLIPREGEKVSKLDLIAHSLGIHVGRTKRGRRKKHELLLAASGGDAWFASRLDPGLMRALVDRVFECLGPAGVRAGDTEALEAALEAVARVERVKIPVGPPSQDPDAPTETRTHFRVLFVSGGRMLAAERPTAETRGDTRQWRRKMKSLQGA